MTETTPTARDYVIAICKTFEIAEKVLMHKTHRGREAATARQVMWRLMKDANYSVSEIGRRSGRDHSTVLHGLTRFEIAIKCPVVAAKVEAARLLVPQIAHRRAHGEIFDLDIVRLVPIEETRPRPLPVVPVRVVQNTKAAPAPVLRKAPDHPGDPFEVMQMRAHIGAADAKFAEALRGEMA